MLEAKKIYHQYVPKGNYTLKNISFALEAGQLLAIVGETGSGKTSLLKILAGLEPVSKGGVYFQKKKLVDPREQLIPGHPAIELVAQDFRLFPHHTVYDNLEYQLRKHKADGIDKRIKGLLRYFDLTAHKNKKPAAISGGQQQKLALAKALAHQPKVLLMDEPFAHLDFIQTQTFKQEVKRLKEDLGLAIILVTHTVQDALSIADEMMILQKGQILQKAKPLSIYNRPRNAYVAQLTGYCNLLSGTEVEQGLSKRDLKKIKDFDVNSFYCIRPKFIGIKEGRKATVQNIEFEGLFYLVEILTLSGVRLKTVVANCPWSVGDRLGFMVEAGAVWKLG